MNEQKLKINKSSSTDRSNEVRFEAIVIQNFSERFTMKTRIKQYFDIDSGEYYDFVIEIKSERDNKYHPLWNGDKLHTFKNKEDAERYLDSVKTDIEWLVKNEPENYKMLAKKQAKITV